MSNDDKISMPSSGGGLMKYYEGYKSKIEFSPYFVIVGTIIVMVIIVLLHMFGPAIFGY